MEVKTRETKPLSSEDASCARHRLKVGGRVKLPQKHGPATLHLNRRRLSALLDRLVAAHCWRDASAVLSVLFEGNPRSYSPSEDRRNFLVAMELRKRFCREKNYHSLIKATYEIWMGKVSWHKKGRMKVVYLIFYGGIICNLD
ncbi:hypothetical protein HPP92_010834 [Vanilla planifolia]|nr:hypothetical protein HPP92_010834 [Vanilla planifolia]